jgi:hypothetical protein
LLKSNNIIIGGDLNFTLGTIEIWGPNARPDSQLALFTHSLIANGFIDIEPIKLL